MKELSRRGFVKGALATGVAALLAPSILKSKPKPEVDPEVGKRLTELCKKLDEDPNVQGYDYEDLVAK